MGVTEKSVLSCFVFKLLMESWAASPLEGWARWAPLAVADCLGLFLKRSMLISASGSFSADLGILSGTVVLMQLPMSRALCV